MSSVVGFAALEGSTHVSVGENLLLRSFTVEEYHQMIAAGILRSGEPYELLDGLLVRKMTKNPPHIFCNEMLADLLRGVLPAGYFVNTQNSITCLHDGEPEPDISVIRGSRGDFRNTTPTSTVVPLVIEIADATLGEDRGRKLRIYAAAGIPDYWIVNLKSREVEMYSLPAGSGEAAHYDGQRFVAETTSFPIVIDGQELGTLTPKDFLP